MRPTVLIVDDHAAFRAAARALLEREGFDVVGEAADGAEALAAVRAIRPLVVLLDISLPDRDGISIAIELGATAAPPRVVLISSRQASDYGPRLLAAPARGFLAKRDLSGKALAELIG